MTASIDEVSQMPKGDDNNQNVHSHRLLQNQTQPQPSIRVSTNITMTEASPGGRSKGAGANTLLNRKEKKGFSNLHIPTRSEVLVVENYTNRRQDGGGKSPNSPNSPVSSAKRPTEGGILVSKDSSKAGFGQNTASFKGVSSAVLGSTEAF